MSPPWILGGIGRVLAHPGYRLFWWSHAVHATGRILWRILLGWYMWEATNTVGSLASAAAVASVPSLVSSFIAGALADRYGCLRILRLAQITMLLAAIVALPLGLAGLLDKSVILGLAIIVGIADGAVSVTIIPYLTRLLPRRDWSAGIAMDIPLLAIAGIAASALSSSAIRFTNMTGVLVICIGCYAVFFIALRFLEPDTPEPSEKKTANLFLDLADGVKCFLCHRGILTLLAIVVAVQLLIDLDARRIIDILRPIFIDQLQTAATISLSTGLGAFIPVFWVAYRNKISGTTRILIWSLFVAAIGIALISLVGAQFGSSVLWLSLVFIIPGTALGVSLLSLASYILLMSASDVQMRARFMGLFIVITSLVSALEDYITGFLDKLVNGIFGLALGGLILLGVWYWAHRMRPSIEPQLEGDKD